MRSAYPCLPPIDASPAPPRTVKSSPPTPATATRPSPAAGRARDAGDARDARHVDRTSLARPRAGVFNCLTTRPIGGNGARSTVDRRRTRIAAEVPTAPASDGGVGLILGLARLLAD